MTRTNSEWRSAAALTAVALFAATIAVGAFTGSVHAEERRGGGHEARGGRDAHYGGGGGGYYRAPPVVYGSPYYAPPPVVYGPGFGLNINIR